METKIKVGDILYGMWHYSMTYPVWFKVIKVTDKQAKAVRLRSRMVQPTDGFYNDITSAIEDWCWDNDVDYDDLDFEDLIEGDDGIIWEE